MEKALIVRGYIMLFKSTELHIMTSWRKQISRSRILPSSNLFPYHRIPGETPQYGCCTVRDHKIARDVIKDNGRNSSS